MRATKDCTSRTSSRIPSQAQDTAFSADFLDTIRALGNPPSARSAVLAGPWEAEEMADKLFAVCRRDEPFSETGRAFGVFRTRADALQTAAILPAVGAPMTLHLNANGHRLGYALHDGQEFLGHLSRDEERLLPHLHVARCLRSDPEALALLLESAGPAALTLLGRALHRRIERIETTAG
jgi:hypothetical protein